MSVLTTTSPGQLATEIKISDKIIEIAEQQSAIVQMTNIVKGKGQSAYVVDIAINPASIVTEFASVSGVDPSFKQIKLKQKRMASAITLSNQVLNDSAVDLNEHVSELLSYRILNGIEAGLFNSGDADGVAGLQNLFLHNSGTTKVENIQTSTNAGTANTYQDFVNAVALLAKQPEHMAGAVFAVADLTAVAGIKDGMGNPILTFDNVPSGAVGRIAGIPVFRIASGFSDTKTSAVLLNPANAIVVSIADDAVIKNIGPQDTTSAYNGSKTMLADAYVDARICNPRAIVIVNHA